jgi:hypothetical protein
VAVLKVVVLKVVDAKATVRVKAEKPDVRVASVAKADVVARANAVADLAKAANVADDQAKVADDQVVAEVDSALARLRFRLPWTPTTTA